MFTINENYLKLPGSYLFSTIAKKVNAYQSGNPEAEILRLGIGMCRSPVFSVVASMSSTRDENGPWMCAEPLP